LNRFLLLLFLSSSVLAQKYSLNGYVREAGSGELLINVNVVIPAENKATASNVNGFFSILLEGDSTEVVWSYVGYKPFKTKIRIEADTKLDITLTPIILDEVEITDQEKYKESNKTQMGILNIPVSNVRNAPALLGEKDVLKIIQLMPGVQKGSEGNAGLYVRGGGPDQNLIKVDDAVIYNPFHVFGFLSLFNISIVKSIELMKGTFPSRYGGRLSSVVEMRLKDGNRENVSGELGIGLLASRFSLEGPFKKGKSSWMISGRRSQIDFLINPFLPKDNSANFYFYDLNAKVSFDLTPRDKIFISAYNGGDAFSYKLKTSWVDKYYTPHYSISEAKVNWGNTFVSGGWAHEFSKKLIGNLSMVYTQYQFVANATNGDDSSTVNSIYKSSIKDYTASYDLEYYANNSHKLRFGIQTTNHTFSPETIMVSVQNLNFRLPDNTVNAQESGLYVEDEWKIGTRIKINYGIRIAHFYVEKTNYLFPEPRIAALYKIREDLAVKAGFSIVNQFMHLLQNSSTNLPTDIWIPADNKIPPQRAFMGSVGIVKDFIKRKFFISLEGYYKSMRNIQGYKEGSPFITKGDGISIDPNLTNLNLSRRITQGNGWSYGAEFLIQKKEGRLTGWIGYTLSWTIFQFPDVNFGQPFFAKYDRRHDISVVANYALTPKITISATWVYATGNRLTLPIGQYSNSYYGGGVLYSGKNEIMVRPYHRLDLGIQFHKKKKKNRERIWEFSVYNAYNNANTFFLFTTSDQDHVNVLKEVTSLPIVPSINYTYKF
jgi:hypothetical protein